MQEGRDDEECDEHLRRRRQRCRPAAVERRIKEVVDVPAVDGSAHPRKHEEGGRVAEPHERPTPFAADGPRDQEPVQGCEQRSHAVVCELGPVQVKAPPRLLRRGHQDHVDDAGHHQVERERTEQVVPPLRQPGPRQGGGYYEHDPEGEVRLDREFRVELGDVHVIAGERRIEGLPGQGDEHEHADREAERADPNAVRMQCIVEAKVPLDRGIQHRHAAHALSMPAPSSPARAPGDHHGC